MIDPLGLLPLTAAAGGGTVDGIPATRLVAAGLTLLRRSAPLVQALRGRRAALLLPTTPAFLTGLAASEGRGAVLVNPLAAPPEVAYQLADADVGAVFTIAALAGKLPADIPRVLLDDAPQRARVVAGGREMDVDLGTHAGDALTVEGAADAEGSEEEAAIVYTSAMEGRPLGAILTHRNLLSNARATIEAAALGPADHSLAVLPFSHLFGLVVSGIAPLLAGGRVTTIDRFNPVRVVEVVESQEITVLVGVPSVFAGLLAVLERRGTPLAAPALRVCMCGGAPLPREVQDRWADLAGVELRQGYGLTEAGPVCLFNRVSLPNRRGTLGVPFPGVDVAVSDGEIRVRGPNVFAGYVSGGAAGLPLRDGWLHTGDAGAVVDGGAVEFRGVIKAMFTRNGFNIYPREIERVVCAMAGVARAAVRAVPESTKENDIVLDVTADGTIAVTEDDVRRWCAANLSSYKQPTVVVVR
jgi:long-chain acyl-CoA synthetase